MYMFLFCLLVFIVVQKQRVIKDDILGLLDKYGDWCNDSVDKLRKWVDEKNEKFEKDKQETGELPTTEESDLVNNVVEEMSKITCIKTDMLILKAKIVEKEEIVEKEKILAKDNTDNEDNGDIDQNDSSDLDL